MAATTSLTSLLESNESEKSWLTWEGWFGTDHSDQINQIFQAAVYQDKAQREAIDEAKSSSSRQINYISIGVGFFHPAAGAATAVVLHSLHGCCCDGAYERNGWQPYKQSPGRLMNFYDFWKSHKNWAGTAALDKYLQSKNALIPSDERVRDYMRTYGLTDFHSAKLNLINKEYFEELDRQRRVDEINDY